MPLYARELVVTEGIEGCAAHALGGEAFRGEAGRPGSGDAEDEAEVEGEGPTWEDVGVFTWYSLAFLGHLMKAVY